MTDDRTFNPEKSFFPMQGKDNIFIFSNHPESQDEEVFDSILEILFSEKYWNEALVIQIQFESQIFADRWRKFFKTYFKKSFEEDVPFYITIRRLSIDYPSCFYDTMNPFDERLIKDVLPFLFIEEAREAYINYLGGPIVDYILK